MTAQALKPGDVLFAELPGQTPLGHEQVRRRPVVVVGLPDRVATPRFPLLIVVPLTISIGPWAAAAPALYPSYAAGSGGLRYGSVALLDQVRSLDTSRVLGYLGSFSESEYDPIRRGRACSTSCLPLVRPSLRLKVPTIRRLIGR